MGLWHSAEGKLTKCQFEREVGSAATASRMTIEYKDHMGLWRSGSAEDS